MPMNGGSSRCNERARPSSSRQNLIEHPPAKTTKSWTEHGPPIENFFASLKHCRAIAIRDDKCAANFLGAIYLAASITWLN